MMNSTNNSTNLFTDQCKMPFKSTIDSLGKNTITHSQVDIKFIIPRHHPWPLLIYIILLRYWFTVFFKRIIIPAYISYKPDTFIYVWRLIKIMESTVFG